MFTKEDHINYWVVSAEKDWLAIQKMYKSKVYLHALFFAHLYLEKLSKALWVKRNFNNTPPKVHNLIRILEEAKITCSNEQKAFMIMMNNFQLEGRYPDYLNNIYKLYKKKNTGEILEQVKDFGSWLQRQLLEK